MEPWHCDDRATIYHSDCREVLRSLPDASVDSVVTDPPYELGFMGKRWDASGIAYDADLWAEALRVLKPGGHLLAFGGTRTWHRLAVAVEDAGFEVRDSIAWLYGSGFPKSLDVSKAIDKRRDDWDDIAAVVRWLESRRQESGVTRRQVEEHFGTQNIGQALFTVTPGSTPRVADWDQWTQLKALLGFGDEMDAEVWRLNGRKGSPGEAWAMRPVLGERDVPVGHAFAGETYGGDSSNKVVDITAPATLDAARWSGWGTALKPAFEPVVVARKPLTGTVAANVLEHGVGGLNIDGCRIAGPAGSGVWHGKTAQRGYEGGWDSKAKPNTEPHTAGRWPANVVLDEDQADALDKQSGWSKSRAALMPVPKGHAFAGDVYGGDGACNGESVRGHTDSGGASRFFYVAKAPARERPKVDGIAHPTVKPLTLMRWLCRLVTPPGGTVLEPFAGSGTTIEAALMEGFRVVAIEREDDYLPLIAARLERVHQEPDGHLTFDASA